MSPTVYLVSGANRGIGLSLVTLLAARPDTIVFAGAREPARATDLQALATAHPNRVYPVKLISADRAINAAAAEEIKKVGGKLDVIIANAAISECIENMLGVPKEELVRHFEINSVGPLMLFQAVWPLLKASPAPKFVPITSMVGSVEVGSLFDIDNIPYGTSKAALNWITRKLHHDFPELIAFPINPGTVETDLLKNGRKDPKVVEALKTLPPITPEESARGILEQVDKATRETHGGQFVNYVGQERIPW
ncbi:NAD(P)-binding protein [Schizophyllum commune Loenen D]|nr:NAD(P)-binding protein [Schizophyllum commune Loenen D]